MRCIVLLYLVCVVGGGCVLHVRVCCVCDVLYAVVWFVMCVFCVFVLICVCAYVVHVGVCFDCG